MPARLRAAISVLLAVSMGCSAVLVRPTPRVNEERPDEPPRCTPVWGAFPALDALGALGVYGLTSFAVGLGNGLSSLCDTGRCKPSSGTPGYVLAGALAASAVYGLVAGGLCERQRAEANLPPGLSLAPTSSLVPAGRACKLVTQFDYGLDCIEGTCQPPR